MKRIKVLRVKAHCYPEIVRIPLGLDSLQKEVGGPIQAVYPWEKLFHNPEEFSVQTDAHGKMCLDVRPSKPEDGVK